MKVVRFLIKCLLVIITFMGAVLLGLYIYAQCFELDGSPLIAKTVFKFKSLAGIKYKKAAFKVARYIIEGFFFRNR